jgi:hypothetical protein
MSTCGTVPAKDARELKLDGTMEMCGGCVRIRSVRSNLLDFAEGDDD